MSDLKKVLIVIPCYNEEVVIDKFFYELDTFIQKSQSTPFSYSVLIVDNNSTDRSKELISLNIQKYQLHSQVAITDCSVQGYGAALKKGFQTGSADYYGFADLDSTYPLESFFDMMALVQKYSYKMITTNRFSDTTGMPWIRRLGNTIYKSLVNIFYQQQLPDVCSGMRIFERSVLPQVVALPEDGLNFSIALTLRMLQDRWAFSIYDIEYRERLGASKLSVLKDGVLFFKTILEFKIFR